MGGDPFEVLLRNIKKYSVSFTVGSDAHIHHYVGKSFKEMGHLLKIMGLKQYCTFEKMKKRVESGPAWKLPVRHWGWSARSMA